VIAPIHLKSVLAKSDLLTGIESQVVPRHTHGWFWFLIAAEKLEESSTTPVDLPVRRLNVDGILGEAGGSLRGIALIPTIGDPLEKLPELCFRNMRVALIASCHNQT
jgi:hypothetical protein